MPIHVAATSVAYKDDGREVGGAVGKGGQPRTDGTSAKNEAVHVRRTASAGKADAESHEKEQQQNDDFDQHEDILPFLGAPELLTNKKSRTEIPCGFVYLL